MADNKTNTPDTPESNPKDTPPAKDKGKTKAKAGDVKGPEKLPSRRNVYIGLMVLVSVFIVVWRHYIAPTYFADFKPTVSNPSSQVETVGKPEIGGPFNLVNQDGVAVTEADFKGKYMLIYFGYTYCPDVCPTSLSAMADALDILGPKADQITPVFITVDPERDDPEALKMYVDHFHPRLVGLTGTLEQVKAAAKVYKAYYAKSGDGYDDGDYTMDHSSITYLMGPDGKFITHFGHGVDGDVMAKKLAEELK